MRAPTAHTRLADTARTRGRLRRTVYAGQARARRWRDGRALVRGTARSWSSEHTFTDLTDGPTGWSTPGGGTRPPGRGGPQRRKPASWAVANAVPFLAIRRRALRGRAHHDPGPDLRRSPLWQSGSEWGAIRAHLARRVRRDEPLHRRTRTCPMACSCLRSWRRWSTTRCRVRRQLRVQRSARGHRPGSPPRTSARGRVRSRATPGASVRSPCKTRCTPGTRPVRT